MPKFGFGLACGYMSTWIAFLEFFKAILMLKCIFAVTVGLLMYSSTLQAQVVIPVGQANTSLVSTNLTTRWAAPVPAAFTVNRFGWSPVVQQAQPSFQITGYNQVQCRPVYQRPRMLVPTRSIVPNTNHQLRPPMSSSPLCVEVPEAYPRLYSSHEMFEDPFEAD